MAQFENDRAVSWKSVIPPHTESTLHRARSLPHGRRHCRWNLEDRSSAGGETDSDELRDGKAYWQTPMPPGAMHKDVNDTDRTIELIVVEQKEK